LYGQQQFSIWNQGTSSWQPERWSIDHRGFFEVSGEEVQTGTNVPSVQINRIYGVSQQ